MRVDLDAEEGGLESLSRFQSARTQARQLFQSGVALAALALMAWALAFFISLFSSESIWPVLLNNNAAALLVLAAGAQSAYWVASWRNAALNPSPPVAIEAQPDEQLSAYERFCRRLSTESYRLIVSIGAPALWLAGLGGLAWWSVQHTWTLALPGVALGT